MTRKWGDTGLAMMGSRHVLTITYPDPDETLLGTPEELPTSEPETPQVEYTIAAAHLPNIGGATAIWTPLLYASGKNLSGSTQAVYYRLLKNDVSIREGSWNVSNNNYWSRTSYDFYDVAVGDRVQMSVWAANAGVDFHYKALFVQPTRLQIATPYAPILYRVVYSTSYLPVLTAGDNPVVIALSEGSLTIRQSSMTYTWRTQNDTSFSVLQSDPTYGLWTVEYGDDSRTSYGATRLNNSPFYRPQTLPTQIVYYPLAVR
jgi:hypothetical protein